jgi:hypothetical protein
MRGIGVPIVLEYVFFRVIVIKRVVRINVGKRLTKE